MTPEQPDSSGQPDPAAARVAQALRQAGSVMVYRTFDERVATVAGGRTGYGPDREAALRDLARQLGTAGAAPGR